LIAKHNHSSLFCHLSLTNGTARFEKCKQLMEYQNFLLLLKTSGGQKINLYLNVVHFFNISVN